MILSIYYVESDCAVNLLPIYSVISYQLYLFVLQIYDGKRDGTFNLIVNLVCQT